jgi:hypothetical protein
MILLLFPQRSAFAEAGIGASECRLVFPCHALHDKLPLKGASQPGAVKCLSSMIGGIAMNDDSSSSRRNLLLGVGGAGLLAAGLAASSPRTAAAQGTDALTTQDISLAQAQAVVEAAIAASDDKGLAMDIAVVDAGANLKAFARMDGAWLGSIDIAIKKARTARFFNFPT